MFTNKTKIIYENKRTFCEKCVEISRYQKSFIKLALFLVSCLSQTMEIINRLIINYFSPFSFFFGNQVVEKEESTVDFVSYSNVIYEFTCDGGDYKWYKLLLMLKLTNHDDNVNYSTLIAERILELLFPILGKGVKVPGNNHKHTMNNRIGDVQK